MNLPTIRHEDERRILTEWVSDIPVKRCKVLEVKGRVVLGNHYHNNNDSVFYILRGKGNYTLKEANNPNAKPFRAWLFAGDCIFVPRGVIHTFVLYPDTILLEATSEPYNANDEIAVEPLAE